jgi:hypothetical protein
MARNDQSDLLVHYELKCNVQDAGVPSARPFRSLRAAQMVSGRSIAVIGDSIDDCVHCAMRRARQPPRWWRPAAGVTGGNLLGMPIHEMLHVRIPLRCVSRKMCHCWLCCVIPRYITHLAVQCCVNTLVTCHPC